MRLLFAALVSAASVCALAQQTHPDPSLVGSGAKGQTAGVAWRSDARKLLQLGIGSKPIANVRAVIYQRGDSRVMQQIQVEIDTDGRIHQTVLAPMQFTGYDLVDDGKHSKTYSPDDKTLIIQPSARQNADDLPFRMKLIDRNYRLEIVGKEKIAGRVAAIIEANPKSDALEKRSYAIDEKTGLLLRLQTSANGGAPVVQFETKFVDFPDEFAQGTFTLKTPMGVSTKIYKERCVGPELAADLARDLGFHPVMPANLPHGFAVQQLQSSTSNDVPAVLVRVTDGLAKATVFQWRSRGGNAADAPDGMMAKRGGRLTFLISGDLPRRVKQALLDSFVRAAGTEEAIEIQIDETSWAQELPGRRERFELLSGPEELAALLLAIPLGLQI